MKVENAFKKRLSNLKANTIPSPLTKVNDSFTLHQDSIEEVSEDSENKMRQIQLDDVPQLKDKLFNMISENLFESVPEERIERIKLATFLESLSWEQF